MLVNRSQKRAEIKGTCLCDPLHRAILMGYRYIRRDLLVNIILLSTVGGEEVWNDASFPKPFTPKA